MFVLHQKLHPVAVPHTGQSDNGAQEARTNPPMLIEQVALAARRALPSDCECVADTSDSCAAGSTVLPAGEVCKCPSLRISQLNRPQLWQLRSLCVPAGVVRLLRFTHVQTFSIRRTSTSTSLRWRAEYKPAWSRFGWRMRVRTSSRRRAVALGRECACSVRARACKMRSRFDLASIPVYIR